MFNIDFFMKTIDTKKKIVSHKMKKESAKEILTEFENKRSEKPNLFNMETTNHCNMKCIMCPRTSLMTRQIDWIDDEIFSKAINSIEPYSSDDLKKFDTFVKDNYEVLPTDRTEDSFYFYIVSRHLTLHGFGEPILDPHIISRVKECTDKNIPTYFSCVPANIDVQKVIELMNNGLGVIKFSMDALDDEKQKYIRGKKNNFTEAYEKILKILEYKQQHKKISTKIVITMIALENDKESVEMYQDFMKLWQGKEVFAYVKSQDNRWYYEEDGRVENKSHYNYQYCEFPWTSMTVMANGEVVPCTQDYDTEISSGNIKNKSLEDIWNSQEYKKLREYHVTGNFPKGHKCNERCDIKKIYQYLEDN